MFARDQLKPLAQASHQVDQNVGPAFTIPCRFFPAVARRSDWTSAPFLPLALCALTEIMYQRARNRLRTIDEC